MFINLLLIISTIVINYNLTADCLEINNTEVPGHHDSNKVLSRRKRFLIFPEGSSFQLVFCVTTPAITAIGDIFLWGNTAALAYELPQDPYSPFNHKADPLHRRADAKVIYYLDDDGRVMYKRPYTRKPIVNPAFAKRSADAKSSFEKTQFEKITQEKFKKNLRKQMHASKYKREFLNEHMDGNSVEFHRSNRASLYSKIESLLDGLGGNGRQCVLKTLCLVGQSQNGPQGSFFQEMMRVVFTLPKGEFEEIYESEYEEAYLATESCEDLYPECKDPLTNNYYNYIF